MGTREYGCNHDESMGHRHCHRQRPEKVFITFIVIVIVIVSGQKRSSSFIILYIIIVLYGTSTHDI